MKKNVAGQKIGCQMVSATDGSAFTSAVTVYVCGDAGTQAAGSVGSGACAHEGNGYHTYAPAGSETNYDLVAFTFVGTGAVPATVQVFTAFPQTGDAYDEALTANTKLEQIARAVVYKWIITIASGNLQMFDSGGSSLGNVTGAFTEDATTVTRKLLVPA
jgi:hypothetical protein